MIPFTINNDSYFLPQSWEETKYEQYDAINKLYKDETLTSTEQAMHIVSILAHLPLETIESAGIGVLNPLFQHLDFLTTLPEAVVSEFVTINGVNYYARNIETVGELAAFERANQGFIDDEGKRLPYILAILLRKRIKSSVKKTKMTLLSRIKRLLLNKEEETDVMIEYESLNMNKKWLDKRAKMFSNLLNPVQILGLSAFFLSKGEQSKTITRSYSAKAATVLGLKNLSASIAMKNMDGYPLLSSIWNRICCYMINYYVSILERS